MRSKICCVALPLCMLFVALGCGFYPSPKVQLKDRGLFGEHPLMRMESFGSMQGSVSGSFFLGIGSVNGSFGSEFKIQFYWSPRPGEIIATALPYSMFSFINDETKSTPTVEFIFDSEWLLKKETLIDYSENRYPNLNSIVLSDLMELAKVRISNATLEKEVYLPKIR